MRAGKIKVFLFSLLLFGCSDVNDALSDSEDLTKEECDKIGGRIIEGIGCAKDLPKSEMKEICKHKNMQYSEELNACLE